MRVPLGRRRHLGDFEMARPREIKRLNRSIRWRLRMLNALPTVIRHLRTALPLSLVATVLFWRWHGAILAGILLLSIKWATKAEEEGHALLLKLVDKRNLVTREHYSLTGTVPSPHD